MADQKLELAGLGVVGQPGFEFGVMGSQKFGQLKGILGGVDEMEVSLAVGAVHADDQAEEVI